MPKIDGNEFLNTFQQNTQQAAAPKKDAQPPAAKGGKQPAPVEVPVKPVSNPPNIGAPAFNPTYKVKAG